MKKRLLILDAKPMDIGVAVKTLLEKLVLDCDLPVEHLSAVTVGFYDELAGAIVPDRFKLRGQTEIYERFDILFADGHIEKDCVRQRQITGNPCLSVYRESPEHGQSLDKALYCFGQPWVGAAFIRVGFDEDDRRKWRAVVIVNQDLTFQGDHQDTGSRDG